MVCVCALDGNRMDMSIVQWANRETFNVWKLKHATQRKQCGTQSNTVSPIEINCCCCCFGRYCCFSFCFAQNFDQLQKERTKTHCWFKTKALHTQKYISRCSLRIHDAFLRCSHIVAVVVIVSWPKRSLTVHSCSFATFCGFCFVSFCYFPKKVLLCGETSLTRTNRVRC